MDDVMREEFVERATAFLEANASRKPIASNTFVWGEGDDNIRLMGPEHAGDEVQALAAASAWRAKAFDAGLAWAGGPTEYGGGGLDPELNDLWRELESEYARPRPVVVGRRLGHGRPGGGGARQRGPQASLPRSDLPRRPAVLAAAQRARGRLRPGRPEDPRGARRRRVDRQRPEGVELDGPPCADRAADGPHRPGRAQAPGPDDVPPAAGLAGRGDPSAEADERPGGVQRGVPHRRARARRQPRRRARQRLACGADDADVRAGVRRCEQGGGERPARATCSSSWPATSTAPATRSCARSSPRCGSTTSSTG